MIDIFNIQENKISTNLNQYPMTIIGNTGDGKSFTLNKILREFATDSRKPLFLFFEDRYQNIPNIMPLRIHSIPELKVVIQQLSLPKAKELYSCIVIDTVDKFEEMAEQYVVQSKEAEILDDIGAFGKGTKYFRNTLRLLSEIKNLGFPLHYVVQAEEQQDAETKVKFVDMKLNKNTAKYIKQDSYLVGYLIKEGNDTDGTANRKLTFTKSQALPSLKDTFGLPIMVDINDISNFKTALEEAIAKKGVENITNETTINSIVDEEKFEDIVNRGLALGNLLAENNHLDEALAVLKKILGQNPDGSPILLNTLREGQKDSAKMVVIELESLVTKFKIKLPKNLK